MCTGEPHAEAPAPPPVRYGAAYAYARSTLVFGGEDRVPFDKHALVLSFELPLADRWTLATSVGAVVGGSMELGADRWRLGPGWVSAIAGAYRLVDGGRGIPFVLLGASSALSGAETRLPVGDLPGSGALARGERRANLFAADFRASITAGWVFGTVRPYAAFRAFGGPVYWSADPGRTGTDAYHVQPALGLALHTEPLSLFVEAAPVFEQAIVVGASIAP